MIYMNSLKRLAGVVAVLLVTISVAQATQSMQEKQDACMKRVEKKYNDRVTQCSLDYSSPQEVNQCVANAAKIYAASLQLCVDTYRSTKPVADYGVGGPNADGLDGWHPKGSAGKGLTSGAPGPVDGGSSGGGGKGDHPKHSTGTFDPSTKGAPLSDGAGQSSGIVW